MLAPSVRRHLQDHDWPGNVRELLHFADRVALGLHETGQDEAAALAGDGEVLTGAPGETLPDLVARYEARLLRRALEQTGGDVRATLDLLGLPRKTFYDKLKRHGIQRSDPEAGEG